MYTHMYTPLVCLDGISAMYLLKMAGRDGGMGVPHEASPPIEDERPYVAAERFPNVPNSEDGLEEVQVGNESRRSG